MSFLCTFHSVEIVNSVCLLRQMYVVKSELPKAKAKCLTVLHVLRAKDNLCIISWAAQLLVNTLW